MCPSHAVNMQNGYPVFASALCIGCGHCGIFCTENAFGFEPLTENILTPREYISLLEARRSIREFSDKVPSEEEIKSLISVLSQSPTGVNQQGMTVRVISGKSEIEKLLTSVRRTLRILSVTGIPQIAGRLTGMSEYISSLRAGDDVIFRGAPVVLFFHVPKKNAMRFSDGIIAATTVMHHAVSMGLGTLWNGIAEKLYPLMPGWHVPEVRGTKLTAVLCIGYPAVKPKWKAPAREYSILDKS
jgi:nitroreductase